jgi:hypothetical protein
MSDCGKGIVGEEARRNSKEIILGVMQVNQKDIKALWGAHDPDEA